MRVATITVLVVAILAFASPAAAAQDSVSRAAGELPARLFEPPPDGVPAGARGVGDGAARASITLAIALLGAAAIVGYLAGSSSRTSRS